FVDPVSGERLPWSTGGGAQLDSEPLTASPRFSCTSVVTGNSGVEAMNLRVRFCRSPACTALIDNSEYVEEWYRIERPFYTGKRTYFRNFESPTSPTVLDVPYCSSNRPCFNGRPCVNNHCGCATDADCGPARLGWTCSLPEGQCLRTVTRCNVVGCIGTETPFNMSVDGFCTTDTGPHFCQQNPSFDYVNPCAD
ncbi:MAG: hypothetical protein K8H88_23350, partial [Sandaracinaceae bacterium]|nr:hypothetical protein [Sandaracinaceae bacterium]